MNGAFFETNKRDDWYDEQISSFKSILHDIPFTQTHDFLFDAMTRLARELHEDRYETDETIRDGALQLSCYALGIAWKAQERIDVREKRDPYWNKVRRIYNGT
jgi:hypothetical protein